MKKALLMLLLFPLLAVAAKAQNSSAAATETVTFRFVPKNDMFYIPWGGNDAELARLYSLVDEYRTEINAGRMPVHVDGYCVSPGNAQKNFKMVVTRSNRVKSELIIHKGLVENNFITQNHTTAYTSADGKTYRDMVVVTLRIPVKATGQSDAEAAARQARERAEAERLAGQQAEKERLAAEQARQEQQERERLAAEQAEKERAEAERLAMKTESAVPSKPYCIAIRTNLLYDAVLLPSLGVEWRINRDWGVKLDGSLAYWGDNKGLAQEDCKIEKVWVLNPEIRYYMDNNKRFYLGASGNVGQACVYGYLLGNLLSTIGTDDTGYRGDFWNAGFTVGYQLPLGRSWAMDFNLGLGYTRFHYDTFAIVNGIRVFKERDITQNFWGPTQAGVSLVWKLGSK